MDLNKFHTQLLQTINEDKQITGASFEEEFFNIYVNYLVENEEIFGEVSFLHFEMPITRNQKVAISGYSYNEEDNILNLILVDDISFEMNVATLNLSESDRLYKRARNFFTYGGDISKYGEESNEAVNLADALYNRKKQKSSPYYGLNAIKIFILTDKKLSRSLNRTKEDEIKGVKISTQLVGIERIFSLSNSRKGKIDIELDFNQYDLIPAIKANETRDYESYLCNINGLTLAQLYNQYGSRLIESNVRSFLQTRGKVNKGIRLTILKEPEKFFAFNNGLTCTAKHVEFNGQTISKITGLQIVNGGQTTASLANVMVNDKKYLSHLKDVSVPMKLNIIKNLDIEDELVPDISRYANSQNKVSDVDLASNHPFHKKIEELSRKISTPPIDGFSHGTYWYYERASGQYAQETYKMPKSQKTRFLDLNPKKQLFKKSDFAKYFNIYRQRPDIASKGGVTAFKSFTSWIMTTWEKDSNTVNQEFYKEMIANIILFKELDKVTKNGAGSNGYKANINAYTLSYLYWYIDNQCKQKFDYSKIWQKQTVNRSVIEFLDDVSYKVRSILTATDGNVTEYAKKATTWEMIKEKMKLDKKYDLSSITISKLQDKENRQLAKQDERVDNELYDTTLVYKKIEDDPTYYKRLLIFIDNHKDEFIFKQRNIVAMLATNKYLTDKQSKIALQTIQKAELEGFDL